MARRLSPSQWEYFRLHHLEDVPIEDIRRFETEFLDHVERNNSGALTAIRETGQLADDTVASGFSRKGR